MGVLSSHLKDDLFDVGVKLRKLVTGMHDNFPDTVYEGPLGEFIQKLVNMEIKTLGKFAFEVDQILQRMSIDSGEEARDGEMENLVKRLKGVVEEARAKNGEAHKTHEGTSNLVVEARTARKEAEEQFENIYSGG